MGSDHCPFCHDHDIGSQGVPSEVVWFVPWSATALGILDGIDVGQRLLDTASHVANYNTVVK